MANKNQERRKDVKKKKGEHKKHREQTEYQRTRDAVRKRRKKGGLAVFEELR